MKKRVMIVDDDPMLQELFSIGLESEGYEVAQAANGMEGQRLIEKEEYDLIVLDLLMPVMDGKHFINWLRREKMQQTPVLILSSMINEEVKKELEVFASIDVVCKPVGLEIFLEKVRALIVE